MTMIIRSLTIKITVILLFNAHRDDVLECEKISMKRLLSFDFIISSKF